MDANYRKFKIVRSWLKEGKKVRPIIWREECFIFWDENSLCCRDEKKEVIDISKLVNEDWEIYKGTLSDKEVELEKNGRVMYWRDDVKELIKVLKEDFKELVKNHKGQEIHEWFYGRIEEIIDARAGKKLT